MAPWWLRIPWMLLLLLLLLSQVSQSSPPHPGARIRITKHAIHYVAKLVVDWVVKVGYKEEMGEVVGTFGNSSYTINNIVLGDLDPDVRMMSSPEGLALTMHIRTVSIAFQWRATFKHGWINLSTKGGVLAAMNGAVLKIAATLEKGSHGQPKLKGKSCLFSPGNLSVKFTGPVSNITKAFDKVIGEILKAVLPKKMCDALQDALDGKGNIFLSSSQYVLPVGDSDMEMDCRLFRAPATMHDYVDVDLRGEILWKNEVSVTSQVPAPLPSLAQVDRMLYIQISEYTFNTLGEVLYKHGKLHTHIATTVLYDHGVALSVNASVRATTPPILSIHTNLMQVYIRASSLVLVTGKNISERLQINTMAVLTSTGRVHSNKLLFNFKTFKTENTVTGQKTQKYDFSDLFDRVVVTKVVQWLNEIGAAGLSLPVIDYGTFIKPTLQLTQGALLVATDIAIPQRSWRISRPRGLVKKLVVPHNRIDVS